MLCRIVLADDHRLFREGLKALIAASPEPTVQVVAEAANVADTLSLTREHTPDALVLDIKMPGGQAIDVIRALRSEKPQVKVLVLTMYDDQALMRSVLSAGGHGYLLKRSAFTEFAEALNQLMSGHTYLDPALRADANAPNTTSTRGPETLTPREREVLALLARGFTYSEVGKRLQIGVRTVETHRRKVTEKLGFETRAELLRFALDAGMLSPGDIDSDLGR